MPNVPETATPQDPLSAAPEAGWTDTSKTGGLVFVFELGRAGRQNDWAAVDELGTPDPAHPAWVHLDMSHEPAREWLRERSGLAEDVTEALLAEETRPRATHVPGGTLVILRGVNLNPGREPDDLLDVRLWVDAGRVVSLRRDRVMSIRALRDLCERGEGPAGTGGLVADLAEGLTDRLEPLIEDYDGRLDDLEERVVDGRIHEVGEELAELRREVIRVRRYLHPQRDALVRLASERAAWLRDEDRRTLQETAERTIRIVEDLDEVRDRAGVVQDQLRARAEERLNRTTYRLTVIAAIAMPLTVLTGLLGINVGGMPGADDGSAFWIVSGGLAVLVLLQVLIFRKIGWL